MQSCVPIGAPLWRLVVLLSPHSKVWFKSLIVKGDGHSPNWPVLIPCPLQLEFLAAYKLPWTPDFSSQTMSKCSI